MTTMISVEKLTKSFGKNIVLDNIDLSIQEGEVVAIIGPSGSGKSTLLRCLNLLEKPDNGIIKIAETELDVKHHSKKEELALRNQSAMVFQSYNLFKNKTALENITLAPLVNQKLNKAEALAVKPKVLLFDEPTSALDPERVNEVLQVIQQLAKQKITMVIVTHEMDFAKHVADRIIFMADGHIVEQGPAKQVIDFPQQEQTKRFVRQFADPVEFYI